MDAEERRQTEAAMAKILQEKKTVEADPAAAVRASFDAALAKAKRRALRILFWVALAAASAVAIYLRGRG